MIIGTFSFKLRAVNNSSLPVSHGRLLHAALLDLVRQYDKDLSAQLHDSNVKPFSFGLLNLYPKKSEAGKFKIEIGNSVVWKVNSLDTRLTRFLIGMQSGFIIRIGSACFQVDDIRYYDNCIIRLDSMNQSVIDLTNNKILFKGKNDRMTNHYIGVFNDYIKNKSNYEISMKLHEEL